MNKKRIAQIRAHLTFSLAALLLCVPLAGRAQTARLDLHLQRAPLKQAMSEIERQTSYRFVPNIEIDIEYPVSVDADEEPLKTVLDRLFASTPYTYSFLDSTTTILLSKRSEEQPATVSGLVVDAGGRPVVGASVLVAGTTVGTSTDAEGRFSLSVPSPSTSRLTINFLGYAPQEIEIGTRTEFRVVLEEAAEEIDSVVVTALGIKRSEKALAYTVAQVAAEDITMVKDANFVNALSGKVAGAVINQSSSGVGGAAKITMRGMKSIMQSSNALYVVDGIPMFNNSSKGGMEFDSRGATESIADLNPDDIASMSVMTGAAASALYGSDAANGAVLITTKKGEAGKLKVTLSSNTEFLSPLRMPEFQTRYGTGPQGQVHGFDDP